MSQFKPKKLNIDAIHAGQKYPEARTPFLPSDLNEIIEVIYGESIGVENSAKRAFLLTSSSSLIDISIKNNQIIFPKNTHIFADNYFDAISNVTYLTIPEDVNLLKFGVVVYDIQAKILEIQNAYSSGTNYNYLYLFSFEYKDGTVVTDLSIPHLVNGEKQNGDANDIIVPKTKEIYTVGADYINISAEYSTITFPTETFFGEYDFPETIAYYFGDSKTGEGKQALAVVLDTEFDIMEEGAIKFINPLDLIEAPNNYKWLFTLYFDGNEFVYCDLEAPFYVDGKLGGDAPTVEIVQTTGESTTAVMSQKASTESFVPKVTTANSSFARLYGVDHSGNQYVENIGQNSPTSGSIVKRTSTGEIICAPPTTDNRAVTLGYANENYMQKISYTPTTNKVPTIQQRSGKQNWADLTSESAPAWSVCQRNASGATAVGNPQAENQATPKSYVDAVYRHEITLSGGFDYSGTKGYMSCTVYSRKSDEWDWTGYNCTLTGRTTATGIINIDGTAYTIVGVDKNDNDGYVIYYVSTDGTVSIFYFMDGDYFTFTDTVTKMI